VSIYEFAFYDKPVCLVQVSVVLTTVFVDARYKSFFGISYEDVHVVTVSDILIYENVITFTLQAGRSIPKDRVDVVLSYLVDFAIGVQ
jgi:hypothetical protein